MSENRKEPIPLPQEDLGRGGDAASSFPAGLSGERKEIAPEPVEDPGVHGPRQRETKLPASAGD